MTNFFKNRWHKDNFWNLMFFATFFTGLLLGSIMPQPFGGVIFWLTPIAAIFLVQKNSNLVFDKEKLEFTTLQGLKIQKHGLMFLCLMLISFFLAAVLTAIISESSNLIILLFLFTFLPSLYCILMNFPIAVYFKKEAWIGGNKMLYNSSRESSHSLHNTNTKPYNNRSIITDPSYRYLGCNIYHKR